MQSGTHAGPERITSLEAYLAGRKVLMAGREVLFAAVRTYLRPSQRPDAQLLGDARALSPARDVADEEWVANAARGYLTILENPSKGRKFRLCVLQQGYELRIGVRMRGELFELEIGALQPVRDRVTKTFGATAPTITELDTGETLVDWHFDAKHLYTDAQALEDAVFRVNALFETALQATS